MRCSVSFNIIAAKRRVEMADKDAPPSFKKSTAPTTRLRVQWRPESQLVTQFEAEQQVNPEPVQPEGLPESQGDSQVTTARSSSAPALLSASIGPQAEQRPRSPSPTPSPTDIDILSPLSFQMGLTETKILVERSLSVFVYTDYFGKPRPGNEDTESTLSEIEEGSLPDRPHTDPHPGARSGIPAAIRARASNTAHILFDDDDSSHPQSASKPRTIPTIKQSRELSKKLGKKQSFFTVVKAPTVAPALVSCIYICQLEKC